MGTFTPLYNWQTDKANGIKIRADRMDGQDGDIATGLTDCVTRDGQSPATANLPMGGFKHTGVALASARTDYLRASQIQDNDLTYCLTAGTIDAYTASPSPAAGSLVAGLTLYIRMHASNLSTTPTLNISGLGATTIAHCDLTPLAPFELLQNGVYEVTYAGTAGILLPNKAEPVSIHAVREKTTIVASPATGTIDFDIRTQASLWYTSNATGNWCLNLRGNSSTTLDSFMSAADDISVVLKATQGGSAFYQSSLLIDGAAVTPKWVNGVAPSAGSASGIDIYSLTITKTAAATFTVVEQKAAFA